MVGARIPNPGQTQRRNEEGIQLNIRRFATCVSTFAVSFAVLGLGSASAGVVYTNATTIVPPYSLNGILISAPNAVTDSFTLSDSTNVNGVDFFIWTTPGDSLASLTWAITTGAFSGTTEATASATSFPNPVSEGTNGAGFAVIEESFSFSNVLLGPGKYWLALSNALAPPTNTDPIYWDIPGTGSETFDIRGTEQESEGTPEPGTAALLGAGLLLAGILGRRFV
jgi:hypothetical protein